ncbi:HTH domain-containing protein [Staphylococcus delphini]|uniref:helix-turn-helix transcriptional regulator n=1 Tax=Staphylococcus delphini TaxID=53344 RepID=UPI0021D19AE5|nr:HTH domain-containing protein [Staphylococcus delphini]UXS29425.1 HTH domain-containing protein [Staphylococcus delphini]
MNRAQRLLSIYTRLIHHQKIDKTLLADEFNVNERTIKRDIQEIRNYLYDNEEWLMKKDILFNYKDNNYLIQSNHQMKNIEGFEVLLIYLAANKAVIPHYVKEALRYIVYELFPNDKQKFEIYLNNIKSTNQFMSHQILLMLYQAIEERKLLHITTEEGFMTKLLPIKVVHFKEDWQLVYRGTNLQEQYLPLSRIFHVEIDEQAQHTFYNKMEVILEMDVTVWSRIKDLYQVNKVSSQQEHLYTVNFNIASIEAFELCLLHSPHIRIIGPPRLYKQFVTYINQLCQVYLYQEIP